MIEKSIRERIISLINKEVVPAHNLTSIGADAMCKTEELVLDIMISKK